MLSGFSGGPVVKNSPAGDTGLIPGQEGPAVEQLNPCAWSPPRVRALQQRRHRNEKLMHYRG